MDHWRMIGASALSLFGAFFHGVPGADLSREFQREHARTPREVPERR